jgi:hypothetical protein
MLLSNTVPPPQISADKRVKSLATVVLGTVLFFTLVGIVSKGLRFLLQSHIEETLRSRTALTISGSALGELAVLILLILFLRLRGRSLRDLGIWKKSPLSGWILAALMTALYVFVVFTSVLRNQGGMGEVSLFHISTSLAAGLISSLFCQGSQIRAFLRQLQTHSAKAWGLGRSL